MRPWWSFLWFALQYTAFCQLPNLPDAVVLLPWPLNVLFCAFLIYAAQMSLCMICNQWSMYNLGRERYALRLSRCSISQMHSWNAKYFSQAISCVWGHPNRMCMYYSSTFHAKFSSKNCIYAMLKLQKKEKRSSYKLMSNCHGGTKIWNRSHRKIQASTNQKITPIRKIAPTRAAVIFWTEAFASPLVVAVALGLVEVTVLPVALALNASKLWLVVGFTAKTIPPAEQWLEVIQKFITRSQKRERGKRHTLKHHNRTTSGMRCRW